MFTFLFTLIISIIYLIHFLVPDYSCSCTCTQSAFFCMVSVFIFLPLFPLCVIKSVHFSWSLLAAPAALPNETTLSSAGFISPDGWPHDKHYSHLHFKENPPSLDVWRTECVRALSVPKGTNQAAVFHLKLLWPPLCRWLVFLCSNEALFHLLITCLSMCKAGLWAGSHLSSLMRRLCAAASPLRMCLCTLCTRAGFTLTSGFWWQFPYCLGSCRHSSNSWCCGCPLMRGEIKAGRTVPQKGLSSAF